MQFHERVLLENQAWVESMLSRDPDYFERLQSGQYPEAFWIGCSDSRVPAEQLCNASQADHLADLDLVRNAEQPPLVVGLVYSLDRGALEPICKRTQAAVA